MSTVTVTRVLPAPSEAVWTVFTDLAARPSWLSEVESVELLTTGPVGPDTRWRETRVDATGAAVTEELVLTAVDPGRSVEMTISGGGDANLTYVFSPVEVGEHRGATSVTATAEGGPHGLVNLLVVFFLGEFAARTAEGHLRQELDELAAEVLARGGLTSSAA
jgi:uncharacterized protein YndB with AHSA1/START domain